MSEPGLERRQPSPPSSSLGIGQLARRISRWTTNSLVTAMLLVIALGFGREVLHWWHDETPRQPSPPKTSSAGATGEGDSKVLAFGDQAWSIRRKKFAGPRGDVPAALASFCRASIAGAVPHGDAPDSAEQDMLKRLTAEKPVAEEPGQWRLYQWSEGFPIVCGTRNVSGTLHVPPSNGTRSAPDTLPASSGNILAEPPYRVVIWGIGVPAAAKAWTLYVFQTGEAGVASDQDVSHVPLPTGCRRLASIRTVEDCITAFSASDASGESARQFYDRWFAEHDWSASVRWKQVANGWHARFESAAGNTRIAVDVRLSSDSQGHCSGLMMETQKK